MGVRLFLRSQVRVAAGSSSLNPGSQLGDCTWLRARRQEWGTSWASANFHPSAFQMRCWSPLTTTHPSSCPAGASKWTWRWRRWMTTSTNTSFTSATSSGACRARAPTPVRGQAQHPQRYPVSHVGVVPLPGGQEGLGSLCRPLQAQCQGLAALAWSLELWQSPRGELLEGLVLLIPQHGGHGKVSWKDRLFPAISLAGRREEGEMSVGSAPLLPARSLSSLRCTLPIPSSQACTKALIS